MSENSSTNNGALLLSVTEAAALLGISRNLCYEQINTGQIPHVRIGRRVLVSRVALEAWIARESGAETAEAPAVLSSEQH